MTRVLRTEAELREIVREPERLAAEKVIDHIDAESRRFIEASPLFLLASSADDGTCDVSPRGDPPGSVLVLDDHTLVFGDRKGNRRLDSLRNILQRPRVGMLFVVPTLRETLRVNGTAQIVTDAPYLSRLAVRNTVPELAIEVRVEELFLHCGKAFARSSLWDTSTWPAKGTVPTAGRLVRSQLGVEAPAEAIDDALRADEKLNSY
ncbi:MSMEG_1061 family FMN-dependent PPOX-type flavoprotein [Actinophytocola sp.]|uniref:MSMEG_1061 family FMN-dependent PPOX-type flavoprotein n=1 Tax=Actinophytocola sp. TaxID=1872138 RepID=UPI002ED4D3FB